MQDLNYFSLDLKKTLHYAKADIAPFTFPGGAEEVLISFEVDEAEGKNIEPEPTKLMANILSVGVMKKKDAASIGIPEEEGCQLPTGKYFFSQLREILGEAGAVNLAIEVQKEGLWERKKFGTRMYLRYLYEHGSPVTQIFRELQEEGDGLN